MELDKGNTASADRLHMRKQTSGIAKQREIAFWKFFSIFDGHRSGVVGGRAGGVQERVPPGGDVGTAFGADGRKYVPVASEGPRFGNDGTRLECCWLVESLPMRLSQSSGGGRWPVTRQLDSRSLPHRHQRFPHALSDASSFISELYSTLARIAYNSMRSRHTRCIRMSFTTVI